MPAREDSWSEDDDRQVAELLAREQTERSGARVWIAPDDDEDLEGRVSDRGWRPVLIGVLAVLALAAMALPIILSVMAALG